ncbi:MAG: hypothetical protein JWP57_2174 [Spirosoma sp.]|nr:hypothetical protein [Spirosoma sp.]
MPAPTCLFRADVLCGAWHWLVLFKAYYQTIRHCSVWLPVYGRLFLVSSNKTSILSGIACALLFPSANFEPLTTKTQILMKTLFLFFSLALISVSCTTKNTDISPDSSSSGGSNVPTELVGKWLKGSFSMTNFFTYDGQDLGKGYESSRALNITKDGQAEVFLYFHTFDGYCHSHAFTYVKGRATVEGDQLTITATSGRYRGAYGGSCGGRNGFDRAMTSDEVGKQVFKLYWTIEKRDGQRYLVTKFNRGDEDSASDFFKPTNW